MAIKFQERGVDPVLSEEETSSALNMSRKTLRRMRERGDGPERIQISARLYGYRASAINAWLDTRSKAAGSAQSGEAA